MANKIQIPVDFSDEVIMLNFFKQLIQRIEELQSEIDILKSV